MSLQDFGFRTRITGDSFDGVVARVTEALKAQGFGVLSDIDVHTAFKEKLGVDYPRYKILGACNPPLAHKALSKSPDLGLMLPCNVVVRELDAGDYEVLVVKPRAMFQLIEDPELDEVATEADKRLATAVEALKG